MAKRSGRRREGTGVCGGEGKEPSDQVLSHWEVVGNPARGFASLFIGESVPVDGINW